MTWCQMHEVMNEDFAKISTTCYKADEVEPPLQQNNHSLKWCLKVCSGERPYRSFLRRVPMLVKQTRATPSPCLIVWFSNLPWLIGCITVANAAWLLLSYSTGQSWLLWSDREVKRGRCNVNWRRGGFYLHTGSAVLQAWSAKRCTRWVRFVHFWCMQWPHALSSFAVICFLMVAVITQTWPACVNPPRTTTLRSHR